MRWFGRRGKHIQRVGLPIGSLTLAGIILLVGVIAFQQPMMTYALVDPGLDSGNATIDRNSVPGQTILKYSTSGSSTFRAPSGVTNVRVMVVGGGGGGGAGELNNAGDGAGGGGAGEYRHETSFAVTPGAATTVTVGGGGAGSTTKQNDGGTTAQNGAAGGNSVFGLLTARGGGGGGGNDQSGVAGGSGGGAGGRCSSGALTGGASNAVSPGVGKAGGANSVGPCNGRAGAGGGGAGAIGTNTANNSGATGGAGLQNDITGTNTFYAAGGGGGGGSNSGAGANGGSSIGGKGGNASGGSGTIGSANTGSGGGGGGSSVSSTGGNGGTGGTGVVIVRFATQTIPDPPTPGGVSGLKMWYKADSAGNTNSQWNDSTGLGYNLTQGTASRQASLTTNSLNFNPAYVFDGTDDVFRMDSQGIGASEPMTAFYAATSNTNAGGYRYFNEFGDDTPSISINNGKPDLYVRGTSPIQYTYTTAETSTPHVYSFISPNANNQARIVGMDDNEQSQNVTTGGYTTSSGGQSGNTFGSTNGSGGTSWLGPIAEALYFNKVLTPQERLKIVSYLSIKYGTTRFQGTSGAGYADSSAATIWTADSTFKNNIAGIGRDDTSILNQKQSKSSVAGDIVTIGNGAIAATNQANANNFANDRSFLLWGHNGAATNQNTTVDGGYLRMNRIWKAVRTNTVGTLKVRVPKSAVTQGSNGVMYLSTSTTFNASSQKINMTDLGTEYEATVTALPAATSYFSFGSLAGSDIQFVSKTATNAGGDPISNYTPGEPMNYVLQVKNNGPDNAGTVTVTDTLPAGLVPMSGTGGGWNCNIAGQTVTCTRAALNNGVTAPDIIIETNIASSVTGSKANTATASVALDPNTANNSASLTMNSAPRADLSISKGHSSGANPVAGQPHTYNFSVRNDGPSDVSSFTVTDTLDSNLTYASSAPNICSAAAQVVTCTGGTLAKGATLAFTMTVNVSGTYVGGTITNTGTVAPPAGTTDPNTNNNSSEDQSNILVETDLSINKTHSGNFTAGTENDFTITVNNQGPSSAPANSITVTDTLDEDFTYVPSASTNWTCTPSGQTVTCDYTAALNAGDNTSPLTLRVHVDPIATTSTTNTADVSSTTPDSDTTDNSSTDNVTIESEADLGITKAHVGTAFTAGQQEQYTFTVVNNGPSADSPSYTISDTLPAGLSFVSATGEASCSAVAQVVTCTGGAIGAGDAPQVTTMTVAVEGSATGIISNTATIAPAPGVTDPTPGNDTSTDNVNVEPNADLSITKSHTGDLTAGDNEVYEITVHNAGPSNVSSFTVTDTLDDNLTFQATSGCSAVGQVVTCTGGAITSGADAVINLNVTVSRSATPGGTISNTVTVAPPADVNDPQSNNNSNTANNTVDASADLEITKSHTGNFDAGSNTNTFTIEVTNNGPSDASTFTVTDVLPAGLTYVSATETVGVSVDCANAGQTVTCTGGPSIGAGESSTISLVVAVDGSTAGNTVYNNTASVSSATPDPNTGNNSDPDSVTIDSKADLAIAKTNDTDFTAGADEEYVITITNNGPSNVSGFTVTDTLPAEVTYVESTPNICSNAGQDVTCNGGAIQSGASYFFRIKVHVDSGVTAGTVINNTADVATVAPTTDPTPGNNSSTDNTTVVNVTDLSIDKNHSGAFLAGGTGQYTFTVTNSGPSATPMGDVEVTDTLPGGMTFASNTGTGWDCTGSSGQNVTCIYSPALAVSGTTPVLTVNVDITPETQGQVTNTGTVISTLDDSNPPDDSDSDTVTVGAEADLTATKTAQGSGSLIAGQSVTYRFEVTNDGGPSLANNVTVTDDLQGHFSYQSFASVSGGTWDCGDTSGTVTCTLPSLGIGDTAVVDVTLKVAEDAPNPVENAAAVTFNGTDPSPANPSTSNPVSYSADLQVEITHEQKTYHAGDTVNYTITAINHGPSAADDAVLTVTIPEGLTIEHVSAQAPGGDSILSALNRFFFPRAHAASNPFGCSLNGNKLVCTAGTMFVGSYPIYVTGKLASNFGGPIVLTAHITSSTPDPNPSDSTASDTISEVLAATGQNPWVWIATALVMVATAIAIIVRTRRPQHLEG